jgi:hypothetical protein
MKTTLAISPGAATLALAGCIHDSDFGYGRPNGGDRQEARRACIEVARERGYRSVDVDSIDREGKDEWRVMMSGRDEGRDHRLRCDYQDRSNRARLTQVTR